MKTLIENIEKYGFECQAGSLENCKDWKKLKKITSEIMEDLKKLEKTAQEALDA